MTVAAEECGISPVVYGRVVDLPICGRGGCTSCSCKNFDRSSVRSFAREFSKVRIPCTNSTSEFLANVSFLQSGTVLLAKLSSRKGNKNTDRSEVSNKCNLQSPRKKIGICGRSCLWVSTFSVRRITLGLSIVLYPTMRTRADAYVHRRGGGWCWSLFLFKTMVAKIAKKYHRIKKRWGLVCVSVMRRVIVTIKNRNQ